MDLSVAADSLFLRTSVTKVPQQQSDGSKVPIGCVLTPMAGDDTGNEVPLVNFGTAGIVRCKRCRAYINPYVVWVDNGRRWRCNLCGLLNEVPQAYFSHIDANGKRKDREERPELMNSTVEIVAPGEYMVRAPQPPVFFFVIDVSQNALNGGYVKAATDAILQSLDSLPEASRAQIGFITFDTSVHFYNLNSDLSAPQMLCVSDLENLFLPVPEDLLVDLNDSRSVVESLLQELPHMFGPDRAAQAPIDCALGAALLGAERVMGHIGGKLCVFASTLPSLGDGKLAYRESAAIYGTEQEVTLLRGEDKWIKDRALELSRMQICVELFLVSSGYSDAANLSQLAIGTAGHVFYYPQFHGERDAEKLTYELSRVLTRPLALEAVMRIRCTRGMRISSFHGNHHMRANDLMALPNCGPDNCYAVNLTYEEPVLAGGCVCIQAALLYTTTAGERRIRVMNTALPICQALSEAVDTVNVDVAINVLAKQAVTVALRAGLDTARQRLHHACLEVLRGVHARTNARAPSAPMSYGAPASAPAPAAQPKIPDSLQLLPLYTMALQKGIAFRGGNAIAADERVFNLNLMANMKVDVSRRYAYPRMFSIHDMPAEAGLPISDPSAALDPNMTAGINKIRLPSLVNLSRERLQTQGIYLLENSVEMYLWVGSQVDAGILQALFGVTSLQGAAPGSIQLQRSGNDIASRLDAIRTALCEESNIFMQIWTCTEGDPAMEQRMSIFLVEDKSNFSQGNFSYQEYMQHVMTR